MTRAEYTTVQIPSTLAARLDELVEMDLWGYRSRTEAALQVLRWGLARHYEMAQMWADLHEVRVASGEEP